MFLGIQIPSQFRYGPVDSEILPCFFPSLSVKKETWIFRHPEVDKEDIEKNDIEVSPQKGNYEHLLFFPGGGGGKGVSSLFAGGLQQKSPFKGGFFLRDITFKALKNDDGFVLLW